MTADQQPEPRRHGLRPGTQNLAGSGTEAGAGVGCLIGCLAFGLMVFALWILTLWWVTQSFR